MKVSGHSDHSGEDDSIIPVALAEITLSATPEELRAMAAFLADCANAMDAMGATYDHIHLSDRMKAFQTSPHFVVVRS